MGKRRCFSVAAPAGHSPWNGGRPVFFLHMDESGRDGFSSRLLSIRAGGAKASPASSLSCTSNSRACGISTKPTCTIENCWNTGAILLRGWHHQFRGVGGSIGNSGTAAHAAVPELPRRITPRRWKIPASRRNTFTRRMNCGMIHLYPTIMPWGGGGADRARPCGAGAAAPSICRSRSGRGHDAVRDWAKDCT